MPSSQRDSQFEIVINRCDICKDRIAYAPDYTEYQIDILDEIDYRFKSECDKLEPRLVICDYCQKEHITPSYELDD